MATPGAKEDSAAVSARFDVRALLDVGMPAVVVLYHDRTSRSVDAGWSRAARQHKRRMEGIVRHVRILAEAPDGMPLLASFEAPPRSDIEEPAALSRACREALDGARPFGDHAIPQLSFFVGGLKRRPSLESVVRQSVVGPVMAARPLRHLEPGDPWVLAEAAARDLGDASAADACARLEGTIASGGFSRRFTDAMRALRARSDATHVVVAELFSARPAMDAARAFAISHPYLSEVDWHSVLLAAEAGGRVEPGDVLPTVPAAMLRRLAGLRHADLLTGELAPDAAHLVPVLQAIPVDWWPGGPEGRRALGRLALPLVTARNVLGLPVSDLVASCRGDWAAFEARCLAHCSAADGPPRRREDGGMRTAVEDAADAANDLGDRVVLPLLARALTEPGCPVRPGQGIRHRSRAMAMGLMFGGKSLPAVLETSLRWHRSLGAINAAMPVGTSATGAWPAPFTSFRHGRVLVVPVTDVPSLFEEGAPGQDRHGASGLAHCVASYRRAAQVGEIHILSVRRELAGGGYERLSTVEATVSGDGTMSVRQHRGLRNGHPPAEARAAVAELLKGTFAPTRPRDRGNVDSVEEACGYDWTDGALVEGALAAYAPCLPRRLRGLGADGAAAELGFAARPEPAP